MKGYIVSYYVPNTGYVPYANRKGQTVVYTNHGSAKRQARRILQKGTPNRFSGCGLTFTGYTDVQEVTIR